MKLREKNKARNLNAILRSAEKLLLINGYEKTNIREIAKEANIGVGTVYNYFSSKSEIVIEMVSRKNQKAFLNLETVKSEILKMQAQEGLLELCKLIFTAYAEIDRSLLRTIFGLSFLKPETIGDPIIKQDIELLDLISSFIEEYQSNKKLTLQFPAEQLAMILYSCLMMGFIQYACINFITKDMTYELLKTRIKAIFIDWKYSESSPLSKENNTSNFIDEMRKEYNTESLQRKNT